MPAKFGSERPHEPRDEGSAIWRLCAQVLPNLLRWTRGRLPQRARRRMDSGDLVQEALIGALKHLPDLGVDEVERLRKYAQQSIRNRIRDEIRRSSLCEVGGDPGNGAVDKGPTPLESAIDAENRRRFQEAVSRLDAADQDLVVGRVDLDLTYEELAAATGRPSAAAARMGTRRALLRVARLMGESPPHARR